MVALFFIAPLLSQCCLSLEHSFIRVLFPSMLVFFFCLSIHFLFFSLPHSDQKTSHQTKGNGNGFTIMKCLILILYTIEATEANTENKHLCGNLQFVLVWLLSDFRNDCALIIAIIYQRQFTRGMKYSRLEWLKPAHIPHTILLPNDKQKQNGKKL